MSYLVDVTGFFCNLCLIFSSCSESHKSNEGERPSDVSNEQKLGSYKAVTTIEIL